MKRSAHSPERLQFEIFRWALFLVFVVFLMQFVLEKVSGPVKAFWHSIL